MEIIQEILQNEMLLLYIESAVLSIFGGSLFSLIAKYALHEFVFSAKTTAIAALTTATLFWSTWMLPQAILLASTNRPIFVILILTVMFVFYLLGVGVTTFIISKWRSRRRGLDK